LSKLTISLQRPVVVIGIIFLYGGRVSPRSPAKATGRDTLFIFDNMVRTEAPKEVRWTVASKPTAFWLQSFARRPPMFVFEFDAALLTFR